MKGLISELLDFRKFDQSIVTLKLSNVDICEFSKEIYLSFSEMALKKNIIYQFEKEDKPISCWIDHNQMEKVIINLLSNAFKFTPNNGTIKVSVQQINQQRVKIAVTNSGKAISKEDIPYIFDRFYQAKNVSAQANPGTGIGLALAKNIVELITECVTNYISVQYT